MRGFRSFCVVTLICSGAVGAISSFAQSVDMDAEQKGFGTIERAGKLVSIRLKPHAKGLELFLVGKDAAQIKSLTDWNIEAAEMEGEKVLPLTIVRVDDRFVIQRPKNTKKPLRVKVQSKEETETFNLDMTPK